MLDPPLVNETLLKHSTYLVNKVNTQKEANRFQNNSPRVTTKRLVEFAISWGEDSENNPDQRVEEIQGELFEGLPSCKEMPLDFDQLLNHRMHY